MAGKSSGLATSCRLGVKVTRHQRSRLAARFNKRATERKKLKQEGKSPGSHCVVKNTLATASAELRHAQQRFYGVHHEPHCTTTFLLHPRRSFLNTIFTCDIYFFLLFFFFCCPPELMAIQQQQQAPKPTPSPAAFFSSKKYNAQGCSRKVLLETWLNLFNFFFFNFLLKGDENVQAKRGEKEVVQPNPR